MWESPTGPPSAGYLAVYAKQSETQSLSRARLCNPVDSSLPDSSVHGTSQAKTLEWVAISYSRGSSLLRDRTWVSCIAVRYFTIGVTMLSAGADLYSCLQNPMGRGAWWAIVHGVAKRTRF